MARSQNVIQLPSTRPNEDFAGELLLALRVCAGAQRTRSRDEVLWWLAGSIAGFAGAAGVVAHLIKHHRRGRAA